MNMLDELRVDSRYSTNGCISRQVVWQVGAEMFENITLEELVDGIGLAALFLLTGKREASL